MTDIKIEATRRIVPAYAFGLGVDRETNLPLTREQEIEIEKEIEKIKKEQQRAQIISEFEQKSKALVAQYPQTERETWAVQVAEAEAIMGGATTAPMLSNIIGTDDLSSLRAFAQKVLQNRDNLAAAMGQLLREKREALRALDEGM